MEIYEQMHSVLTLDGKKFLVDIVDWAQHRLDAHRQTQFSNDIQEILTFYSDRIIEEIYSTAKDQNGSPILIGFRYIHPNVKQLNEKYEYWCGEFANDPAVQYNAEHRIQ